MKMLNKLWLMVHPVPRHPETVRNLFAQWEALFARDGKDPRTAICIMPNHPPENARLAEMARKYFTDRCFVDPNDRSDQTKLIVAEDLLRTLSRRGSKAEWLPYEIWTSNMARYVVEGLKKDMLAAGYGYDPDDLAVHAFGGSWQGCMTKYANFVNRYLDVPRPVQVHPELGNTPGRPIRAEFMEMHLMPRHVWLYLFKTDKGYPMAQFADGLRAVWDPPHAVRVAIDTQKVEVVSCSPNAYLQLQGAVATHNDHVILDVGDGCHGAFSMLIGRHMGFDNFKSVLLAGKPFVYNGRGRVNYGTVPYQAPVTMVRGDDE